MWFGTSVIGQQQHYLAQQESRMHTLGAQGCAGLGGIAATCAAAAAAAPTLERARSARVDASNTRVTFFEKISIYPSIYLSIYLSI